MPIPILLQFTSVLLLSNIFLLKAQQELPPFRILFVLFFHTIFSTSTIYQFSCFKGLAVFIISKVTFFTINIKRGSMLAKLACYYTGKTGVVFRQICSCTEFTGPNKVPVSYMAKFLTAYALCSRRDFKVFYYLSSCTCN